MWLCVKGSQNGTPRQEKFWVTSPSDDARETTLVLLEEQGWEFDCYWWMEAR